jgi:hypothetical protein
MARLVSNSFVIMTIPGYDWPGIRDPSNITAADHLAHTTPRGTLSPEDLGLKGKKHKGQLMKVVGKMLKQRRARRHGKRRKDERY